MTEQIGTRRLLIGLNLLPWMDPPAAERAMARFRDPEVALAATERAWEDTLGRIGCTEEVRAALRDVEAEEARAAELEARIVTWADAEYPSSLRPIPDPPPVLYVRGQVDVLGCLGVAVVGARRATPYGRRVAADLAQAVVRSGAVVVSGLARGVDGAAHRGALEAGGRTLAVLGNGFNFLYPAEHEELAEAVTRAGALVTEFPLASPPLAAHFPRRNRVISGLAHAVVVVEAADRSGSLVTATAALAQGKDVFAVPGSVYSPASRGTNRLILDGATPVLDPAGMLERMGIESPAPAATVPADDREEPVLERMGWEPVTLEELGDALGEPPERLAGRILTLELQGRIARLPGDWVQRLR